MTPEQVEECVLVWQKRLRLLHWDIEVRWDEYPENEDTMANITPVDTRYYAVLRFAKDIFDYNLEKINEIIAHELTHLHLDSIYHRVRAIIKNCSYDTQTAVNEILYNEIEKATDALSIAFARHTPTPQCLVKKSRKKKTILDIIEE